MTAQQPEATATAQEETMPAAGGEAMTAQQSSERWYYKLLWLALDKLVLVVVAGLAILFFQNKAQQFQNEINQSLTVSRVYSDIQITERKALVDAVTHYFLLVEDIRDQGNVEAEQASELKKLRQEIQLAVSNMAAVDPQIATEAETLLSSIKDTNLFLVAENHPSEDIEEKYNVVRGYYNDLLKYLPTSAREIAKTEYEAAKRK
jgi:hypothetical protein